MFFFLIINFYFSEKNKKNVFRSFNQIDNELKNKENKLIVLESNTEDIVEYSNSTSNENKKEYKFWELVKENK